jgi:hypothetical protein
VIEEQNISGYWKSSAEPILARFFEGGEMNDSGILDGLKRANVNDEQQAYLTLVAIHVLKQEFDE